MQILINDARGGGPGGGRDTLWENGFTDGVIATITGIADLTNNPFYDQTPGLFAGDYIIGTFTADATDQSFLFGGSKIFFHSRSGICQSLMVAKHRSMASSSAKLQWSPSHHLHFFSDLQASASSFAVVSNCSSYIFF